MFYGGIGDFLIGKNWLVHLIEKYGLENEDIDIYVKEKTLSNGKCVFNDVSEIKKIYGIESHTEKIDKIGVYDLVFEFYIFPYVRSVFEEKIAAFNTGLLEYVLSLKKFGLYNYGYGFCHSYYFYKNIRKLFQENKEKNYYSFCDVFDNLGITEQFKCEFPICLDEEACLEVFGLKSKQFITIDTGQSLDYINKANTRSWPHHNWNFLAKQIKNRFPDICIVQMGVRMTENDDIEADIHLNGKTDLEQVKVLLKNALLHVDYEGGLVHIRHIVGGGTSVVLFGSTAIERHQYSENINIRTDKCEVACEWSSHDWLFKCPKYDEPLCILSITPEMVFKRIEDFLIGQGR